nr:hypothetical protein [Tanacetum cinerariifolium]
MATKGNLGEDDIIANQDLDDKVDEDNNNDGIILTGAIYVALLAVALGHGSYSDGNLCLMVMKNVKRLNDTLCHGLTVEHKKEEEGSDMNFSKRLIRISNLSSREAAIYWSSKELKGQEDGRGAFILTLESVTRLRGYLTLDLLSIIAKPSRGILSKKLPYAAESKAS